jgi:hypothetical protein
VPCAHVVKGAASPGTADGCVVTFSGLNVGLHSLFAVE